MGAMLVSSSVFELDTVWLQVAAVSHSAPTLQKGTLGAPSLLKTTGGQSALGAAPARSSRQVTNNPSCCIVDWQSFVLLSLLYKVVYSCVLACPAAV